MFAVRFSKKRLSIDQNQLFRGAKKDIGVIQGPIAHSVRATDS